MFRYKELDMKSEIYEIRNILIPLYKILNIIHI